MLSKRIFWLTCAAIASWLIWMRLRQRHDDFATTIPQFAPPQTFTPPTPAAPLTPPAPAAHQPEPAEEPAAAALDPTEAPAASAPGSPAEDSTLASAESATTTAKADPTPAGIENTPAAADLSENDDDAEIEVSGYCMRCKTKRAIQNAHRETTESGRSAARGNCPVCGANMFTLLAMNDET